MEGVLTAFAQFDNDVRSTAGVLSIYRAGRNGRWGRRVSGPCEEIGDASEVATGMGDPRGIMQEARVGGLPTIMILVDDPQLDVDSLPGSLEDRIRLMYPRADWRAEGLCFRFFLTVE
jgi:hypothetical protein